jgi:deoxyribonuclease-1-like protein
MKKFISSLLLLTTFLSKSQVIDTSYLNVISWNIQNFGKSKSSNDTVMNYIVQKVKSVDILVIQEVSTSEFGSQAVAKLDDLLDRTGSSWDYIISNPTSGEGSERYAYIFKKTRVKAKDRGVLEPTLSDKLNREPFRAIFIFKGQEYYFFNLHLVPTSKSPEKEANHLSDIGLIYSGKKIILVGDFNLKQTSPGFDGIKKWSRPLLIDKKTSLKMKDDGGSPLSQEYDNFFCSGNIISKFSDVILFYRDFKTLRLARKVSDHCPIFCQIK